MKIFISYASEREQQARTIYDFLKPFGFSVWFDKESLIGGQDWDYERKEAQTKADLTILVLSPETNTKVGVIQREIKEAQKRLDDYPVGSIHLVTMRTEHVAVPTELSRWQYIDLFDAGWQTKLAKSLDLKCRQLGASIPSALAAIIESSTASQQLIRSIREETDTATFGAEFYIYDLDGRYWEFVNAEIISSVYGSYYRHQHVDHLNEFHKNEWSIRLEEFFREGDFLSLRFFHYSYRDGSAHGNYAVLTKNFFPGRGLIQFSDVVERDDKNLKLLRKFTELEVSKNFVSYDASLDFEMFYDNENPWDVFDDFSFDKGGIVLNFSPYQILPYTYGSHEVRMSWQQIGPCLTELFGPKGPISEILGYRGSL